MTEDNVDELDALAADRLRRGLMLLAEEADGTPAPSRRPHWQPAVVLGAAAAIVALTVGIGTKVLSDDAPPTTLAEEAPGTTLPGAAQPDASRPAAMSISYDLRRLVAESPRVVVGTIVEVKRGSLDSDGGLDYIIGTVRVEEMLRGPAVEEIAAFDYDYGTAITSGPALGAALVPGSRVLLFLADATGTVHENIKPQHWQVTGGAQGLYAMDGADPNAPFSLDQVRAEIRRAEG
ncbi:hypothetical protein [Sporichthya polymorpha]|uniref:hypothetical protein n=1 Tax=Sporichthya polymorpha TaxID=35751 RepID=UPI0003600192|nr:hypothetical protein [Sporichthya polymorpha]